MKYSSKILDSLSRKPFLVILIAVLTTGVAIFLIERDWRPLLEKCADINYDNEFPKDLTKINKLKKQSLSEKISNELYKNKYRTCESLERQSPKTFKAMFDK
jgi:hypothetical protein